MQTLTGPPLNRSRSKLIERQIEKIKQAAITLEETGNPSESSRALVRLEKELDVLAQFGKSWRRFIFGKAA